MLVPMKWLKELVPTNLSTEEIGRRLTLAGLEAESVTRIGEEWDRVFVAEVEKVERHPDADRLVLASDDARQTSAAPCGTMHELRRVS